MKKSFLMIAAALFIFAGCQKEESVNESTSNNVIHIGVEQIAPLTKVAAVDIAANKLSFKWEEGDQVAFDDNERIIIYTCTDPATGEFSGEALDPDATYWVEYPNGYSGTFIYRGNQIPKGHLIMNKEVSGSATTFTLDTHETIIHFKLKGAAKVGSIALSYGDEDDYTLSCGDGVQLSDTATDFYMDAMYMDPHKLSSIAYTLRIYDTNNKELKSVSFHLKEENQETIVDFATPIEVNASSLPAGALKGVFSVSATKKVQFSRGNLQATYNSSASTYTWGFAANQYDCIGDAAGNTTIDSQTNGAVVDLFGWSTASTTYGISTSTSNSDYSGDFVDWGKAIDDKGTWSTLSDNEWAYLFNTRKVNGGTKEGKSYQRATINSDATSVYGMILYPDDYTSQTGATSYTSAEWKKMEENGCVFLPAAGSRNGSEVDGVGGGGFWSSTVSSKTMANLVLFNDEKYPLVLDDSRCDGYSVRLVTDASVTPAPTPTTTGTAKATIGGSEVDVNWVQLWENGPKFAEYNVGAENSKAEDYGGYYNWGMSDVQTSSNFEDYKSGESPLTGDDDTATKLWGSNWRMPTQTDLQGLIDNCDVAWTTVNDKDGCKFTGKGAYASNSVFLPAAGEYNAGEAVGQDGSHGSYWSSTPGDDDYAYNLKFNWGVEADARYNGYSVRAVLAE